MQLTLDIVYKVNSVAGYGRTNVTYPCFEVKGGGSVDIYMSNADTKPSDYTEMTLDSSAIEGSDTVLGLPKWILFKANTGTPEVWENNLVEE